MTEIINRGEKFIREVWSREEALKYFSSKGEKYKAELINDLPENEIITIYKQGECLDLCKGPHMPTTNHIGIAFKYIKVADASWRADSNNNMITRMYGKSWRND